MARKAAILIANGSSLAGGRPSAHMNYEKKESKKQLFAVSTEAHSLGAAHLHM